MIAVIGGRFQLIKATVTSRLAKIYNQVHPSFRVLLLLLAFAFVLRTFLILFPEVIYNDGVEYIRSAKLILSGDWGGSKAPPLYPVLIGLTSLVTSNFELAGIWVSVIFGTLVVLPVYYLGREIFDEKVGILAALFAVVHPFLYLSSGSVLTESVYHFLLATAVLFGWQAFCRGRFRDILLFSLFTSLAYLTRPEAIGFLFILSFWVLFIHPLPGRRRGLERVKIAVLAILCFLVFSSPYLYQLRKETGRWEISKKFSISVGSLSREEAAPIESLTKTKKITLVSFVTEPIPVLKKIGFGWVQAIYKFQLGFHPLLFILAVFGFAWSMEKRSSKEGSFYLLSYFIFYLGLLLPFFWTARRYTSLISTIALPWASLGFISLAEWITPRLKEGRWKRTFPVLFLLFVLTVIFIQGRVIHGRDHRFIQKEAGLWIKDHLSQKGKIMSRLPQEAFYAELPWVRMPEKTYEEIMAMVRSQGIRYLIIDERAENPSAFLEKTSEKELIPIHEWKRKREWSILFEVRPSALK
ncbi:MAG TPA: glycosyltransferase family 39 protein [Thermodesulfobacteriota bacterium]|nr:glycosyltransferase family 39 protein [Thermodesulfobacteriota bacterium]